MWTQLAFILKTACTTIRTMITVMATAMVITAVTAHSSHRGTTDLIGVQGGECTVLGIQVVITDGMTLGVMIIIGAGIILIMAVTGVGMTDLIGAEITDRRIILTGV